MRDARCALGVVRSSATQHCRLDGFTTRLTHASTVASRFTVVNYSVVQTLSAVDFVDGVFVDRRHVLWAHDFRSTASALFRGCPMLVGDVVSDSSDRDRAGVDVAAASCCSSRSQLPWRPADCSIQPPRTERRQRAQCCQQYVIILTIRLNRFLPVASTVPLLVPYTAAVIYLFIYLFIYLSYNRTWST